MGLALLKEDTTPWFGKKIPEAHFGPHGRARQDAGFRANAGVLGYEPPGQAAKTSS
jgi:hypothetical protein